MRSAPACTRCLQLALLASTIAYAACQASVAAAAAPKPRAQSQLQKQPPAPAAAAPPKRVLGSVDGHTFTATIQSSSNPEGLTRSGTFPADAAGGWTQVAPGATDDMQVAQDGFASVSGRTVTLRVLASNWPGVPVPAVNITLRSEAFRQFAGVLATNTTVSPGAQPKVTLTLSGPELTLTRPTYTPERAINDMVVTYTLTDCALGSGPCCSPQGMLLPKGSVCRAAKHGCDVEDTCAGASAECPDTAARDGQQCAWAGPERKPASPGRSRAGAGGPTFSADKSALRYARMEDESRAVSFMAAAAEGAEGTGGAASPQAAVADALRAPCSGQCRAGVCVREQAKAGCCFTQDAAGESLGARRHGGQPLRAWHCWE